MTKILVLWEDAYHGALDRCVRRAIQHLGGGGLTPVELYFDDVRGNGGFTPYVQQDWPIAASRGLAKSRGPIDHLLCVADADRAHQCCDTPAGTSVPIPTQAWIDDANLRWTTLLQGAAPVAAERVAGRFLRWNQESLLIALHDIDDALRALGIASSRDLQAHLRACAPSPLTIDHPSFVDAYRRPQKCFEDMLKAAGARPSKKGAPARDDALDAASRRSIDRLCARVPDLTALAAAILAWSMPGPPSP